MNAGNDVQEGGPSTARAPQRDYLGVLAGPLTAAIATFAVALIGVFGNQALESSQQAATERATAEQNFRLYAEMINQREQVESELRRDVLARVLGEFFEESESEDPAESLTSRLLKLELLALNFGESLSLSPLFVELSEDIELSQWDSFDSLHKDRLNSRLRSLARRVADRQLSALSAGGEMFEFSVPVSKIAGQKSYLWPDDAGNARAGDLGRLTVGDITRDYKIKISKPDVDRETVAVELRIVNVTNDQSYESPQPMSFTLDQFNFPMIDNTRLLPDQRFALVMQHFDEVSVRFTAVCFPGLYASQRDKPFLNEVIEQLRQFTPGVAGADD